MPYKIQEYTYKKARDLGVIEKPSKTGNYKLDVFDKKGELLVKVGDKRYGDYPTFLKNEGKKFADTRRKLYKARHEKDRFTALSKGFFADNLLW